MTETFVDGLAQPASASASPTALTPTPVSGTPTPTIMPTARPDGPPRTTGLVATYYSDGTFTTPLLVRTDPTLDFDWDLAAPDARVPADGFQVRWQGSLVAPVDGDILLTMQADDGFRLWLDGQLLMDSWGVTGGHERHTRVTLQAQHAYALVVEYAEVSEQAHIQLGWELPGQPWQVIDTTALRPEVVVLPPRPPDGDGTGLRFTAYQDSALTIPQIVSTSDIINMRWMQDGPDPAVPPDGFGIRWDGTIQAPADDSYTFFVTSEGGIRLWVDGQALIDAWSNSATQTFSGTVSLFANQPVALVLEYTDPADDSAIRLEWASANLPRQIVSRSVLYQPELPEWDIGPGTGLTATYYADTQFQTAVLTRTDSVIDFFWGLDAPDPSLPVDGFSVRWQAQLHPLVSDRTGLVVRSDGATRLWVNNVLLVEDSDGRSGLPLYAGIDLVAGQVYDVVVEYVHSTDEAWCDVTWAGANFGHWPIQASQWELSPIASQGNAVQLQSPQLRLAPSQEMTSQATPSMGVLSPGTAHPATQPNATPSPTRTPTATRTPLLTQTPVATATAGAGQSATATPTPRAAHGSPTPRPTKTPRPSKTPPPTPTHPTHLPPGRALAQEHGRSTQGGTTRLIAPDPQIGITARAAMQAALVSMVDDMNDMSQLSSSSGNLGIDSTNASAFGNDPGRLRRSDTAAGWAVWHLNGMTSAQAISYHASWETVEPLGFFASADGVTYSAVSATTVITPDGFVRMQAEMTLPAGTNYLKVVFPTGSANAWNPQLGQLTLSYPALPTLPPAAETRLDPLDNGDQIIAGSTNLGFDTSYPASFAGDTSRLRPNDTTEAWAVWQMDGMDAFTTTSYRASWLTITPLSFFASADGTSFTPVLPTTQTTGGDWIRMVDELRLPAGTNYVKVVFPSQSDFWALQLGEVSYRRPVTQSLTSRTITYQYDGLQRLTSASENPGVTQTYAYDLAGNRTDVWVNGTLTQHQTYNAANQVTTWQYDAAGNLLNDTYSQYQYDTLGRVTSIVSGGVTRNNSYNGDGVLVQQGTTRYVHDLAAPLSQILSDGSAVYVYGNPAERLYGVVGSTRTWYSVDALGSLRTTLNDAGIPQATAMYDAWGVPETAAIASFGFTGELQRGSDVWLRARWYGAGRGGFGGRDPWVGNMRQPDSLQPYLYTANNPINRRDPSGRWWWGAGHALLDSSEQRFQNQNIHVRIQAFAMAGREDYVHAEYGGAGRDIDLLTLAGEVWEIKPWDNAEQGLTQAIDGVRAMNQAHMQGWLHGTDPFGRPYDWNASPTLWDLGYSFPPGEHYMGIATDGKYLVDIYAQQTRPGLILWWKYNRRKGDQVPYPILLPQGMVQNKRNERSGWRPPQPVPAYATIPSNQAVATCAYGVGVALATIATIAIVADPVPGDEALLPLIWGAVAGAR